MLKNILRKIKKRIRSGYETIARSRRIAAMKSSRSHISRESFANDLRMLGVEQGDTLFVHSSLKSLGFVEGGPQTVIDALKDAVGPEGTLLLPTYYIPGGSILATCEMDNYEFDPRIHGTNMGALPNAFLQQTGVKRSIHPTHSVSAIGKYANELTNSHHLAPSVFAKGSPWERFVDLPQAKVLGLGISMGPVTFYHVIEDTLGDKFPINIWLDKTYHIPCRDFDGTQWQVPVRPYRLEWMTRRIDNKNGEDIRNWFQQEFDNQGLRKIGKTGEAESWIINGREFFDHLMHLAERGITVYGHVDSNLKPNP